MAKREILFRGWNKKNKKWIYGYYFVNRGVHFISPDGFANPLDSYEDYVVEADTVGQYTGMKDAKGKRIFEGDILGGDGCAHVIQYKEDEAKFVAVLEGRQDLPCGIDQRWINEFKKVVGGSIQERPEIFNF